jgi:tetratricopeptide (TPR) repeat protein
MVRSDQQNMLAASNIEMVGREQFMAELIDFTVTSKDPVQPSVAVITGEGGVGKTRLLHELLLQLRSELTVRNVQTKIVDLYHMRLHAKENFVDGLYDTLPYTCQDNMQQFQENMAYYQGSTTSSPKEREEHLKKALQEFIRVLAATSLQEPLVLAIDTLEKMAYGVGELPTAWEWLIEALPQFGPVTILIAGRPGAKPLIDKLPTVQGIQLKTIDLPPLNETSCMTYLEKAVEKWRGSNKDSVANRIQAILDDPSRRSLIYPYTSGRPILLSLMLDYLTFAPPQHVRELLQSGVNPELWEEHLLENLMTSVSFGDVIKHMGYLEKGMDAELLAAVMQISLTEAITALSKVQDLSFIKTGSDGRLFLHDEIFPMLRKHKLLDPPKGSDEAKRIENGVNAYYKKRIQACQEEMHDLYAIIIEGGGINIGDHLTHVMSQRRDLLTEDIFYRLRHDPNSGIRRWYRYNHEAILAADMMLSIQLEIELKAFQEQSKDSTSMVLLEDQHHQVIDSGLALTPVTRAWAREDYPTAVEKAADLYAQHADLFANPIANAALQIWEAQGLILRSQEGDLDRAQTHLTEAINMLQTYHGKLQSLDIWLAKYYQGFAYRMQGYQSRVKGLMKQAVEQYEQALLLFEDTYIRIEIAYTQNDMGFAEAMQGNYEQGIQLIEEAWQERQKLGIAAHIGLSINSLAMAHILAGSFSEAIKYGQQALRLFKALQYRRGEGMANIALAEAFRRQSKAMPDDAAKARETYLKEALRHAQAGSRIFKDLNETSRQVEALIEIGCANRDWVRHCRAVPTGCDTARTAQYANKARDALNQAASLAHDILYRHVDAKVNLTWLTFYLGDYEAVAQQAAEAWKVIPAEYCFDADSDAGPTISGNELQATVWTQIAKLEVLQGLAASRLYLAADPSNEEKRIELLKQVGECIAMQNAYDTLFSEQVHRGLQQANNDVTSMLQELFLHDPKAIKHVTASAEAVEQKYKFGHTKASDFIKNLNLG